MTNQPLPLDWLLATGKPITQEALDQAAQMQKYANRERIPEPLLRFADLYNELTGQEPTKTTTSDWVLTFEEWKSEQFTDEHIRAAYQQASDPMRGFHVGRPGALTVTIRAAKTKMVKGHVLAVNRTAIDETKKAMDEHWSKKF